jgi:hypothetical protein
MILNGSIDENKPCIIHLDSLRLHPSSVITPIIQYLNDQHELHFHERDGKSDMKEHADKPFNKWSCPVVQCKKVAIIS